MPLCHPLSVPLCSPNPLFPTLLFPKLHSSLCFSPVPCLLLKKQGKAHRCFTSFFFIAFSYSIHLSSISLAKTIPSPRVILKPLVANIYFFSHSDALSSLVPYCTSLYSDSVFVKLSFWHGNHFVNEPLHRT